MDHGEEEQGQKNDRAEEDKDEEKDGVEKALKTNNSRKSRKIDFAQRGKNSRSNSGQNRYKSCSRSRSRSRSRTRGHQSANSKMKKSWKSANAWLNFMQDFRANLQGFRGLKNTSVFRLASEQWSDMTPAEKKPYIDAANKVKRQKRLENNKQTANDKRLKKLTKVKKYNAAAAVAASKVSNRKKNYVDEEKDDKSESEEDSGTDESSNKNMEISDNASIDTDGSI